MKDARAIFRFLLDAMARGERIALVTITDVIGGSSRAPGTHMAVTESGASLGSFSGGCIEAAVIGEAQRVITSGIAESLRFGMGSPFIDIRLPCGGGVDLLFIPNPDEEAIAMAWQLLTDRQPVALRLEGYGRITAMLAPFDIGSGWEAETFVAGHVPDLRLILLGHGAEIQAMAKLGMAYGMAVKILSPDQMIVERSINRGAEAFLLKTPSASARLVSDRRTAIVFLFHDHDWETALLAQALEQDAFYVGAMGSRRTHEARIEALLAHGVPVDQTARVIGPVGLIPATRDPDTLALSTLAQIVEKAGIAQHHGVEQAGK